MLGEFVQAIENRLTAVLPSKSNYSQSLVEGMRYAVLGGGKRLRGSLVCATAYTLRNSYEEAIDSACAIECMHAYSLVHDDLPVMDDADMRRGKPSCHMVFGPAMATLIGDALQPFALNLILNCESLSAEKKVAVTRTLATAAGYTGMVGGQARDIEISGESKLKLADIRELHQAKTGALFVAAVEMGRLIGDSTERECSADGLRRFAAHLGEAFQAVDDWLDCVGSTAEMGKPRGQDANLAKETFPAFLGEEGTKAYAEKLLASAMDELDALGFGRSPLAEIAGQCIHRMS